MEVSQNLRNFKYLDEKRTLEYRIKNLDSKSKKSVMLSYVPNGNRLLDIEKVFNARDVKFDEICFLFKRNNEDFRKQFETTVSL